MWLQNPEVVLSGKGDEQNPWMLGANVPYPGLGCGCTGINMSKSHGWIPEVCALEVLVQ